MIPNETKSTNEIDLQKNLLVHACIIPLLVERKLSSFFTLHIEYFTYSILYILMSYIEINIKNLASQFSKWKLHAGLSTFE